MAKQKRHSPEEIVAKLRQVDVLTGQGKSIAEVRRLLIVRGWSYDDEDPETAIHPRAA